ncbi:hypothetical protein GCM10023100_43030 [Actinocorallia cavernae]|uniref:Uncharacterized protein n=2 Tax=Actinomycetes TaxID=1760 RepID=A0ABN3KRU6_9ACTN
MVQYGDTGDDVVRAGRQPVGGGGQGVPDVRGGPGVLPRPLQDLRVGVDRVHPLRPPGQQPRELPGTAPHVQRPAGPPGQLP